jgi:ElaB/YqjD/DUF883 family membrane-anchored ribosome-binding protein
MAKVETDAGVDRTMRDEMDLLKSDLSRIKDDLGMMAEHITGRARTGANMARDRAQTRFNDYHDSVEQYIEEKPLTTVLAAFGIGLLLGKIFSLK